MRIHATGRSTTSHSGALHALASQARRADRHLVADLNRSMVAADRALHRLGAVERHALAHLRVARGSRPRDTT
jgi:hypothetical protein